MERKRRIEILKEILDGNYTIKTDKEDKDIALQETIAEAELLDKVASVGIMRNKIMHGDKCKICGGEIKASGFSGHLFCWGECYCYINSAKYQNLLTATLTDLSSKEEILNEGER